ncbi:RidA family protein [Rhodococcus oryzae]|uniref:RidA family protein n=1 Tax=Rhodococcus oryzae TaxID=2571143 RepID=A0ABY2RGK0_9NOCA|nr:RidA family protein [Rhodococcus oryzae]TJZ76056.1 RidA family protein [Rhodococcus oryzae]
MREQLSAPDAPRDAKSAAPARLTSGAAILSKFGYTLPVASAPIGAYVAAVQAGNLVYTSGQLPLVQGMIEQPGKVGRDVSVTDASRAAEICTLNALAAIDALVGLDAVVRVVKVVGFVASADDFTGQPSVINGASKLLVNVFGDAGAHARSAVGVAELPLNAPVEVELVVEVA